MAFSTFFYKDLPFEAAEDDVWIKMFSSVSLFIITVLSKQRAVFVFALPFFFFLIPKCVIMCNV